MSKYCSRTRVFMTGSVIHQRTVRIDQTAYSGLPEAERNLVYAYDHEFNLNEARREIKLVDRKYVPQIKREMREIFGNV